MPRKRFMDHWAKEVVAKGIERVLQGQTYAQALAHARLDAKDLKVKKPGRIRYDAYRRYLKPLVEETRLARARAIGSHQIERIPSHTPGQHRAEAVALQKVTEGTAVQVAWVNQTYAALFNEVYERYLAIRDQAPTDKPGAGMQALENMRRVVNDMAEVAGAKKVGDKQLVQIVLSLPTDQMPAHILAAVEDKIRSEVLKDLAAKFRKHLCRKCKTLLAPIPQSS